MTGSDRPTERLREAFATLDETGPGTEACPDAGKLWDAAHARLPARRAQTIVEHIATCPSCAADWRLAMRSEERASATGVDSPMALEASAPPGLRVLGWAGWAAAAAALMAVALLAVWQLRPPTTADPVYRGGGDTEIRSLVPDGQPLPRDRPLLRWTSLGGDVVYSVEVGKTDLTPVASAFDLGVAEFLIPPEALENVGDGESIVWQVEALLPDGRRVVSQAFLNPVE